MNRGRLVPPNLDDRKWQDIVDQAKALIPTYAPQWTDHNPSDLGITLIELFAWMVEGLTYRLNRVPEKNYIEFLNLLGITRDPATPASTVLVYSALPNVLSNMQVPKGRRVSTQPAEGNPAIEFETDADFSIQPINVALLIQKKGGLDSEAFWQYQNVRKNVINPSQTELTINLPKRKIKILFSSLYLNLLASNPVVPGLLLTDPGFIPIDPNAVGIPNSPNSPVDVPNLPVPFRTFIEFPVIIAMGFNDARISHQIQLKFRFLKPVTGRNVQVKWLYSASGEQPTKWREFSAKNIEDGTKGFRENGDVVFKLPDDWEAQTTGTWDDISPESSADRCSAAYDWIGIQLVNRSIGYDHEIVVTPIQSYAEVTATNALTVTNELMGTSNGKPFQFFEFKHAPIFKRPNTDTPYDHVTIQVREPKPGAEGGFTDWATWQQRDDFAAGEGHYYRLDPVTGTLNFGNFDAATSPQGHGQIPPKGSEVKAVSYRYVAGGANGNVGPETLTHMVQDEQAPSGLRVTNPGAATGGSDEESIEDAKRRAPQLLRNRYRAVTAEDYEYLAQEASTDVAIVRCLPPRLKSDGEPEQYAGLDRSPGNVNVIIVPKGDINEPCPEPSQELLLEVQSYLDQRRDLTANLKVTGPRYLPICVKVEGVIWQRAINNGLFASFDRNEAIKEMKNDITGAIKKFLHPVYGGSKGQGWQVGQSISISDLYQTVMPSEKKGYITKLSIKAEDPIYPESHKRPFSLDKTDGAFVRLTDYELVCFGKPEMDSEDRGEYFEIQ